MNVSVHALYEEIGQLYVANSLLTKRIAELEAQLASVKKAKAEPSQTT